MVDIMINNLNEYEVAGHFIRRKDASPQKPSPLYSTADLFKILQQENNLRIKIEKELQNLLNKEIK